MSNPNGSPSGGPNQRSISSTSTSSNRLSIRDHLNQTLNINNQHESTPSNNSNNKEIANSHHHHHHSSYHPFKRAKYHQNGLGSNKSRELTSTPNQTTTTTTTTSTIGPIKSNNYLKCMQADSSTSPLLETLLHGERISCFVVGGEKRLCLHDILNTILKEFSVQQINSACQKLQIACLESSPRQLEILKKNHLLPTGAPNCGLLTQTNAERLCAFLMDQHIAQQAPPPPPPPTTTSPPLSSSSPTLSPSSPSKKNTLKVVHECFGKTYGHIHLNMYSKSDAACVECDTCRKFYTPKNFVCHTHKYESHTRHWGFDSANWRVYLKPVNSSSNSSEKTSTVLGDIKISNKDNIAANAVAAKQSNSSSYNEEFELFKQKFQSRSQSPTINATPSSLLLTPPNLAIGGAFKRKSLSDLDIESSTSTPSLTRHSSNLNASSSFSSLNKIRDHSNGSIENLNTDNRSSLTNQHHQSHHHHPHPQLNHQHHHNHHSNNNSINNINTNLIHINKKLNSLHHQNNSSNNNNNGLSLNDLNNHLMSSQGKNFTNQHDLKSNNINCDVKSSNSGKSNGEHRLLNGLLSKPLNNSNEFSNG